MNNAAPEIVYVDTPSDRLLSKVMIGLTPALEVLADS